MATEEEDGQCCVMEEGTRCSKDATGQPWSFTKRLMRAAWGRHKLEHDEKIPSQRICDHHREMLVNLKRQLDSKRKKPTPAEEESVVSVEFATLQMSTLKKYRKKYNLATGQTLNKGELVSAIERHFASMPVNEGKDILSFLKYIRKARIQRQSSTTPDVQQ